jgi:hypothetical protein
VKRYFAEVAAFNASPPDDDDYFLGDQPFDSTLREMIGVPARSAEDSLAAVEWIIDDGKDCMISLGEALYGRVASSLLNATRDYLASMVQS